jgi:ornithine carbamoyltransferase
LFVSNADLALRGRNILTVPDLCALEIGAVLALASHLKRSRAADQLPLLRGKSAVMLFEKPSLRTRISFEVAMTQLGGHALFAQASEFMLGTRETPEDAARVLSRYVDAIVIRTHAHGPLERFAAAATVPVINALSAVAHPCQALADMLTIKERFGALSGLRIAYVGDGRNNVAASLAHSALMSGISVNFACPPSHRPSETFMAAAAKLGKPLGATIRAFSNPLRAVRQADVVYADTWTSMGEEAFAERNSAALRSYSVTATLMSAAAPHALFMHCLPAYRGQEVAAEVIDGPRSVVFDQAENRLHVQKALLVALLTDLLGMLSVKTPRRHA